MKDYKRLTETSIGCFKYTLKDHKPKAGEFNNYDAFYNYSTAVKILGELEDKIERGEIDYVAEKDKEIARLTAENTNLTVELEVAQRDVDNLTRTNEECGEMIKSLKAENTELRARLSKAVELPCKCEDTLYCVHWSKYNPKGGIITEEFVHKITLNDRNNTYTIHTICNGIWTESKFVAIDFGDILFTDRAKAEARIAELKGGEGE